MGTNSSLPIKYGHFSEERPQQLPWTGPYTLLKASRGSQALIRKTLHLSSHKQAQIYIQKFQAEDKPQFYLLSPLHVEMGSDQSGLCGQAQSVDVYHKELPPSLAEQPKVHRRRPHEQNQIMFMLNEVSHGLELLACRNHPHLWLSPETIYLNGNGNYFLHDMYYWHDGDYRNFITAKAQDPNQLLSEGMRGKVDGKANIEMGFALDEDIYCLGYVCLAMACGATMAEARARVRDCLRGCEARYSGKFVDLLRAMTSEQPERRISLDKLRYRLKMEEEEVIHWEMEQYRRDRAQDTHPTHRSKQMHVSSEHDSTPVMPGRQPQHTSHRQPQKQLQHPVDRQPSHPINKSVPLSVALGQLLTSHNTPAVNTERQVPVYYSPPPRKLRQFGSPSYGKHRGLPATRGTTSHFNTKAQH